MVSQLLKTERVSEDSGNLLHEPQEAICCRR